jgi:hypothetical protein
MQATRAAKLCVTHKELAKRVRRDASRAADYQRRNGCIARARRAVQVSREQLPETLISKRTLSLSFVCARSRSRTGIAGQFAAAHAFSAQRLAWIACGARAPRARMPKPP